LSMSTRSLMVRTRTPEWPFASALIRNAIMARTISGGSGSPVPAAWLRIRSSLEFPDVLWRDTHSTEFTKSRRDPVDRFAPAHPFFHQGAGARDGPHSVVREADWMHSVGDISKEVQPEGRPIKDYWLHLETGNDCHKC
jgi:hypothetical protein